MVKSQLFLLKSRSIPLKSMRCSFFPAIPSYSKLFQWIQWSNSPFFPGEIPASPSSPAPALHPPLPGAAVASLAPRPARARPPLWARRPGIGPACKAPAAWSTYEVAGTHGIWIAAWWCWAMLSHVEPGPWKRGVKWWCWKNPNIWEKSMLLVEVEPIALWKRWVCQPGNRDDEIRDDEKNPIDGEK